MNRAIRLLAYLVGFVFIFSTILSCGEKGSNNGDETFCVPELCRADCLRGGWVDGRCGDDEQRGCIPASEGDEDSVEDIEAQERDIADTMDLDLVDDLDSADPSDAQDPEPVDSNADDRTDPPADLPEIAEEVDNEIPANYCGPLPPLARNCLSDNDCRVIVSSNGCECNAVGPDEIRETYDQYLREDSRLCVQSTDRCDPRCEGQAYCLNDACVYLETGGDQDTELEGQACVADVHCPEGHYCTWEDGQDVGFCKQDCIEDLDCIDFNSYYCNDIGRCLLMNPIECVADEQCPMGMYCDGDYCQVECLLDEHCDPGEVCDLERGECTES